MRKADGQRRGQGLLVYSVDDTILYRFDVRTNSLSPSKVAWELTLQDGFESPLDYPINGNVVVALLGGAAAGFTAKDALQSSKKKHVVAAILGGISGYSLGFKLGSMRALPPDSKKVRDVLDNEDNWLRLEKLYYERVVRQSYRAARMLKDTAQAGHHKASAVLLHRLGEGQDDLDPVDMLMATNQFNKTASLVTEELRASLSREEPFWLSFWWIGLLTALVIAGMALIVYCSNRRLRSAIVHSPVIQLPTPKKVQDIAREKNDA